MYINTYYILLYTYSYLPILVIYTPIIPDIRQITIFLHLGWLKKNKTAHFIRITILHEVPIKHGSLNVPIEHHPTIRYMVYNGYYKVMSNIPKMGHLPTPVKSQHVPWFAPQEIPTRFQLSVCHNPTSAALRSPRPKA